MITPYLVTLTIRGVRQKPSSSSSPPLTTSLSPFLGDGEANLQATAQVILSQIRTLASAPTNARNFLLADVYGLGTHTPAGNAMVQTVFSGLYDLHRGINSTGRAEGLGGRAPGPVLNVAFSQFSRIWDGVFGSEPGYRAFGYVSTEACIRICCVTTGMCDDPEHYFYYIPK